MPLTNKRQRKPQTIKTIELVLAFGQVVYQGGLAALQGALAVNGAAGAMTPIGYFRKNYDATAGAIHCEVDLFEEIEVEWLANDGTIGAGNIGAVCYVADDTTVTLLSIGNSVAGPIWAVDTTKGVAVQFIGTKTTAVYPTMTAGAALAYVANDCDFAPVSGAVYTVPVTAAASTITLDPGVLPDGSWCEFHADGVDNGHTVQYRDKTGPVNLTTALLASKRHHVKCVLVGGAWVANAYTAP
jgi:hypothetical protein